jgi:hypothetical protein
MPQIAVSRTVTAMAAFTPRMTFAPRDIGLARRQVNSRLLVDVIHCT